MKPLVVDPKPRILFVALVNNVGTERVISEMARKGALCALMSPPGYYCAKTRTVMRQFSIKKFPNVWLTALLVRRRIEFATLNWRPQLILPLDDVAAWLLRSLAVDASMNRTVRDLLVTSFGWSDGYAACINRLDLMDVAGRLGVRKPNHWKASELTTGKFVPKPSDFPLFIKAEHTCGGNGVRIARSIEELARELEVWRSPSLRRRLFTRLKAPLQTMAGFRGSSADILVQSSASGTPAFRTIAARQGRVIAGLSLAAEKIHPEPTGASTVVRLVENREMNDTAASITAALGCSGIISYDFMLNEYNGQATLIEMNPRCVGSCHLGDLFGHDICAAMISELAQSPAGQRIGSPEEKLVALFPKELERDPNSIYLQSMDVLHDVPNDEPALVEAYLQHLAQIHPTRVAAMKKIIRGDESKVRC